MSGSIGGELLLRVGMVVMAVSATAGIVALVALKNAGKKIKERLEEEFGSRDD